MKNEKFDLLFSLLYSAMSGELLGDSERAACSEEAARAALKLAVKHDLSHLVVLALKKNGLTELLGAGAENYILKAAYHYQQNKYELDKLSVRLENAGIPFIPLKGSVLRKYYPEPWMRTSCDIDILIHEGDLEKAERILVDEMKYKPTESSPHDVAFASPSGVNVEIHFDLIEEGLVNASDKVLKSVWSVSHVKDGCSYHREMPDDLFYFYHIAHMAKHVLNGGCGIKPFIDLSILDRMDGADRERRNELLARGELLRFSEVAHALCDVWFGSREHDALTLQMEKYVLEGGVYGNIENRMSVQRYRKGSRFAYALSIIILPYDRIKYIYPVLQKHRWLTPVMQVRRWFGVVLGGRVKKASAMLAQNNGISDEQVASVHRFLDDVGL